MRNTGQFSLFSLLWKCLDRTILRAHDAGDLRRWRLLVFDWDEGNASKCQKHGISIQEIETIFTSGGVIVFPDPTEHEKRFRGIGKTGSGRSVFIVYTLRVVGAETRIRPISARYMHQQEVDYYAKEAAADLRH